MITAVFLWADIGNIKTEIIDIDYQFVTNLKEQYQIYYADMKGEDVFSAQEFSKNIGLVIGNEGNGVSGEIRGIVDKTLSIPMQNNVESLNASVSAGIIMFNLKK